MPYAGRNPQALQMAAALAALAPHLAAACVHGSIGSDEEIAYSDFDALVILRDSVLDSPDLLAGVAWRLGQLRRLMFQYDPLQHHGWFVLAEADLRNYCQAWFPSALFAWSRSLLPGPATNLLICQRDSTTEYQSAFANLAAVTLGQITRGPALSHAYRLKGLLSQFMLLPSLYLQARDGTAVFKRESFGLAARDFPPQLWSAMERISSVRLAWRYDMSALQRLALTRLVAPRRLCTRWFSPAVPESIRRALPPDLWSCAAALVRAMQERVAATAR